MRSRLEFVAALTLLVTAVTGCDKTTVEAPDGRQLTVAKPSDLTVKKGETGQVTVKIERKSFRDPVTVSFLQLPAGVVVNDTDKKIAPEESSATFTLKAGPETALVSDHRVEVLVKAPGNLEAREYFKITVKG